VVGGMIRESPTGVRCGRHGELGPGDEADVVADGGLGDEHGAWRRRARRRGRHGDVQEGELGRGRRACRLLDQAAAADVAHPLAKDALATRRPLNPARERQARR
jgi:hypothetical protein